MNYENNMGYCEYVLGTLSNNWRTVGQLEYDFEGEARLKEIINANGLISTLGVSTRVITEPPVYPPLEPLESAVLSELGEEYKYKYKRKKKRSKTANTRAERIILAGLR
tara:strand:+ start:147 stop:473 length:327 start_codon:yes stop_codon:yes gene_type:complete